VDEFQPACLSDWCCLSSLGAGSVGYCCGYLKITIRTVPIQTSEAVSYYILLLGRREREREHKQVDAEREEADRDRQRHSETVRKDKGKKEC